MTPEERLDRLERIVEKQNNGIKDLIRVGRLVTDAQIVTNSQINELQRAIARLTEAQKETDDRLNILIDIADRIIRRNGKPPADEGTTKWAGRPPSFLWNHIACENISALTQKVALEASAHPARFARCRRRSRAAGIR
jgi:hypothetical protein